MKMIAWMMLGLVGCVSKYEFLETNSDFDFIYATVIMTPKSNRGGRSAQLDIYVEAPSSVKVTIPTHSSTLGSFDVNALGFGGGGASDGSTYTSKSYELEPTGFVWQTIPSIPISYIDKRNDPAGKHGVLHTEEMNFVYNPLF